MDYYNWMQQECYDPPEPLAPAHEILRGIFSDEDLKKPVTTVLQARHILEEAAGNLNCEEDIEMRAYPTCEEPKALSLVLGEAVLTIMMDTQDPKDIGLAYQVNAPGYREESEGIYNGYDLGTTLLFLRRMSGEFYDDDSVTWRKYNPRKEI